jgi:hypothetical protein
MQIQPDCVASQVKLKPCTTIDLHNQKGKISRTQASKINRKLNTQIFHGYLMAFFPEKMALRTTHAQQGSAKFQQSCNLLMRCIK